MKTKTIFKSELAHWAGKKFSEYSYSGKKGLPRKSEKPFTPEKYEAALMALMSQRLLPLRKVAEICAVNHNVLKVWRTEKRFKAQVKKNAEEYSRYFIEKYLEENNIKSLEVDFCNYDLDLQLAIIWNLYDELESPRECDEFVWILDSINELFQITLEKLEQEKPIKRSTLYHLCYLQNVQMKVLHMGRVSIFESLKELLSKKKQNKKNIKDALVLADRIDEIIEKTLSERVNSK